MAALYDRIGIGYDEHRRTDPRIAAPIAAALDSMRTLVNVGAGAGAYEPRDRPVIPVEPSRVTATHRPRDLAPAVLASAEDLPLADKAVDAAMAVLTIHHWEDPERGIAELKRVARGRIVLVTVDPVVEAQMWLFADYVPEIAQRDAVEFPSITDLHRWLGPSATSRPIPIPHDCVDGFLLSFWSRPERVLDPDARRATSGFARLDDVVEAAAVTRLAEDLARGAWDREHGALRHLDVYDAGLRLIVAEPGEGSAS